MSSPREITWVYRAFVLQYSFFWCGVSTIFEFSVRSAHCCQILWKKIPPAMSSPQKITLGYLWFGTSFGFQIIFVFFFLGAKFCVAKSWVKPWICAAMFSPFLGFLGIHWFFTYSNFLRILGPLLYGTEQAIFCFLGAKFPHNPAVSSPPVAILWSPPIFATLLADWHWMHKRLVWRPQMACAGRIYGNIAVYEQLQLAIRRHHFIS